MSTVTTEAHTVSSVSIAARSTVWCGNEALRVLLQIAQSRGLPVDTIHEKLEFYAKGIRTWMTTHHLTAAVLEVWDSQTDRAIERYDLVFDYQPFAPDAEETFQTHMERLIEELPERQLPEHCRYRIVLKKKREAPKLPGWSSTELRSVDHLQRKSIGQIIETAAIGVEVVILS